MAVSKREQLNLRRKLKAGGLSRREQLDIRRELKGGPSTPESEIAEEVINEVDAAGDDLQRADFSEADPFGRPPERRIRKPIRDPGQRDLSVAENIEAASVAVEENILGIGSGIAAQPVAGIGGLAKSITSGSEAGQETQEQIQDALTFQPPSERGKQLQQDIGETLEPLAKGIKFVSKKAGDFVFDKTGSPALAAFAASAPEAAMELVGGKGALKVAKARRGKGTQAAELTEGGKKQARKELKEAALSSGELKDVSRGVFKEIEEAGGSVRPEALQALNNRVNKAADKAGRQPRTDVVIKELDDALGGSSTRTDPVTGKPVTVRVGAGMSLTKLDEIRSRAQQIRKDPVEGRVAGEVVDAIDAFLDEAGESALKFDKAPGVQVGKNYRHARKLWGQAKRSEMIDESFQKAGRQASGFENGIRTQFRQILNNKNKSRFFAKDELAAMDEVVKGKGATNIFKLLGRFGFSEGQATNIIGGTMASWAGGQLAGKAGAVIAPMIGQFFRNLAGKSTKSGADLASAVVRAGKDGTKIAEAYVKHVPKKLRNPKDLAKLLLMQDNPIPGIAKRGKMVREAQQIANETKRGLQAAAGTGAIELELKDRGLDSEEQSQKQ